MQFSHLSHNNGRLTLGVINPRDCRLVFWGLRLVVLFNPQTNKQRVIAPVCPLPWQLKAKGGHVFFTWENEIVFSPRAVSSTHPLRWWVRIRGVSLIQITHHCLEFCSWCLFVFNKEDVSWWFILSTSRSWCVRPDITHWLTGRKTPVYLLTPDAPRRAVWPPRGISAGRHCQTRYLWGRHGHTRYLWGRHGHTRYLWGRHGHTKYLWGQSGHTRYLWGQSGHTRYLWGQPSHTRYLWGQPGHTRYLWGQSGQMRYLWGQHGHTRYLWGQSGHTRYLRKTNYVSHTTLRKYGGFPGGYWNLCMMSERRRKRTTLSSS